MSRRLLITDIPSDYPNDRRRRNRLEGETPGWILPTKRSLAMHTPGEEEAWEVRIRNLSRFGIAFISTERFKIGEDHRLRIGRGPMKRARIVRIITCRETQKKVFTIGAEFIDINTKVFAKAG